VINLNNSQKSAVTTTGHPTLVLAGAGTGKTMVIVERIAWLILEKGVDPRNILALTFTNKAANEMRERVAQRLGENRVGAWLGTFHSFGLMVLRRHMETLGRTNDFSVFDEADQLALMRKIVADLPPNLARVSHRDALAWISLQKQRLTTPEQIHVEEATEEESFLEAWRRYRSALVTSNGVDFDDLLVLTVELFQNHKDILDRYRRRYTHIHVDEYQDTNHAQYVILKLLAAENPNLFVVGDEDQSIYSWRGAELNNILDFSKEFPHAQVVRLEQNYRSTGNILKASNSLVAHNQKRLGKTLWTAAEDGEPVLFKETEDSEAEAAYVAEEISRTRDQFGSTAVLFRTNGQSRLVEEALRTHNIPYVVIGGIQFYARKEIKDITAYLRLITNPHDDVALRRIINVPPRGIGEITLTRLEEYARERNLSLLAVLREAESDQTFSSRMRENFTNFVHLIDDLALMARNEQKVSPIVKTLLERIGYREYVMRTEGSGEQSRVDIVDEFFSSCVQRDDKNPNGGLASFLQDLALMSDFDTWDTQTPAVALLTCHAAKGLEFDQVFLIGLEEGLLPHAASADCGEALEEERRLCYVAMTRARKRLVLTAARRRLQYGDWRDSVRSRFVHEIATCGLLKQIDDTHETRDAQNQEPTTAKPFAPHQARSDRLATDICSQLRTGVRVRHAKFGMGVVMFTSGSGKNLKARIKFVNGKSRDFMVSYAPIDVIEGDGQ